MHTRFSEAKTSRCVFFVSLFVIATFTTARAQVRGDVNCDGQLNTSDLTALISVLFGDAASDCGTDDVNADGEVDAADLTAVQEALDPPTGPVITFLGLAGADGRPTTPLGTIDDTPVYFRNTGSGFQLVLEARAGLSNERPGVATFNGDAHDPSRRPDIQIESSTPLGDGSPAVCDGGVPAINPPDFGPTQVVANALNDLACHFPAAATSPNFSCTQDGFGRPLFMGADSQIQFCLLIPRALEVPAGQTALSVRWRDTAGNLGPMQQLILQVGSGPPPPPFTASPTQAATRTPTPSVTITTTPTLPATATRVRTPTQTRTATSLVTPSRTPASPTMATPTNTHATSSATATAAASPTLTPILSATRTAPRPGTSTPTTTPTRTPTTQAPPSATATRSPTVTRTPTPLPTVTRTPTSTRTRTATRTATLTPAGPTGPVITFFGITRADDTLVKSSGTTPDGVPIYQRLTGAGFSLVVEGRPGPSGSAVGRSAFDGSATSLPDLQVEVSHPLGNGSPAVCDRSGSMAGGVPAIDPPSFNGTPAVIAAVNDLACRFLDGSDMPVARNRDDACVMFGSGDLRFVNPASTLQFCGFVTRFMEFPAGDTLVTARLRDQAGNAGATAQIVIHVSP